MFQKEEKKFPSKRWVFILNFTEHERDQYLILVLVIAELEATSRHKQQDKNNKVQALFHKWKLKVHVQKLIVLHDLQTFNSFNFISVDHNELYQVNGEDENKWGHEHKLLGNAEWEEYEDQVEHADARVVHVSLETQQQSQKPKQHCWKVFVKILFQFTQ